MHLAHNLNILHLTLSTIIALIWTALVMFVSSFLVLAYEVLSSTDASDVRSYKDADSYNIGIYALITNKNMQQLSSQNKN